jgi:hypothetical protein
VRGYEFGRGVAKTKSGAQESAAGFALALIAQGYWEPTLALEKISLYKFLNNDRTHHPLTITTSLYYSRRNGGRVEELPLQVEAAFHFHFLILLLFPSIGVPVSLPIELPIII